MTDSCQSRWNMLGLQQAVSIPKVPALIDSDSHSYIIFNRLFNSHACHELWSLHKRDRISRRRGTFLRKIRPHSIIASVKLERRSDKKAKEHKCTAAIGSLIRPFRDWFLPNDSNLCIGLVPIPRVRSRCRLNYVSANVRRSLRLHSVRKWVIELLDYLHKQTSPSALQTDWKKTPLSSHY